MPELIGERKPKIVVMRKGLSATGKYMHFYGHHFPQGKMCYDVGVVNQTTGEIITRHYHDRSYPNPKMEALREYDNLAKGLNAKSGEEEHASNNPFVSDSFRRQLKGDA